MKYLKFISICLMASFAMSISAAVTAKATISVQGDEGKKAAEITLTQDDTAAENFGDPNNAPYIPGGSQLSPGFYAVNGSNKYMKVVLPSLNNLVVKFVANAYEEAYTMSFSGVTGSIILANADTAFVIDATKDYKFTCAKSATVEFTVNPAYTREVAAGDWGTLCLPWASMALEGATYYETLGTKNADGIALAEVSALEAGKPYVFQATAAEIKVIYNPSTEVTAEKAGARCTGSFAGCTVPAGQYLIVDNLLYKAEGTGNSIDANRAYFDVASMTAYQGAPGRRVVFFGGKTTPTNVAEVEAPAMKDGKMMIDGQLVIIKGGKMFNAQGAAL